MPEGFSSEVRILKKSKENLQNICRNACVCLSKVARGEAEAHCRSCQALLGSNQRTQLWPLEEFSLSNYTNSSYCRVNRTWTQHTHTHTHAGLFLHVLTQTSRDQSEAFRLSEQRCLGLTAAHAVFTLQHFLLSANTHRLTLTHTLAADRQPDKMAAVFAHLTQAGARGAGSALHQWEGEHRHETPSAAGCRGRRCVKPVGGFLRVCSACCYTPPSVLAVAFSRYLSCLVLITRLNQNAHIYTWTLCNKATPSLQSGGHLNELPAEFNFYFYPLSLFCCKFCPACGWKFEPCWSSLSWGRRIWAQRRSCIYLLVHLCEISFLSRHPGWVFIKHRKMLPFSGRTRNLLDIISCHGTAIGEPGEVEVTGISVTSDAGNRLLWIWPLLQ